MVGFIFANSELIAVPSYSTAFRGTLAKAWQEKYATLNRQYLSGVGKGKAFTLGSNIFNFITRVYM